MQPEAPPPSSTLPKRTSRRKSAKVGGAGGTRDSYTNEKAQRLLELIARGWSLKHIEVLHDDLPCRDTILKWVNDKPDFEKLYRAARVKRIRNYADEIEDICDEGTNDYMEREILAGKKAGEKIEMFRQRIAPSRFAMPLRS